MRRAVAAGILAAAAMCSGCSAGSAIAPPPAVAPSNNGSAPAWLPPYSAAQLALLKPTEAAIAVPAERVFPRLGAFEYVQDKPVDVRRALSVASLVANVLEKSPRLYLFHSGMRPELENVVALYGPEAPIEPDPWERIRSDEAGDTVFVRAPAEDPAREALRRALAARDQGETARALDMLRSALEKHPIAPIALAIADTLARTGDEKTALDAYEAAAKIDRTLPQVHLAIAELHEKAGRLHEAKRAVAEAIAYYPRSKRALQIADRLTGGRASKGGIRVPRFKIFLDVDAVGAVHIGHTGGDVERIYGGCRAVLRYERDVRRALFEPPRDGPYVLTMAEEVVCLQAAAGTYVAERVNEPSGPSDPNMETLVDLGREDGFGGYAMVEIIGQHRPERARAAPEDVHRAMVRYVERVVLGGALVADPQDGIYTAQR
jgi:tetratricopeptide (TPR) repeat protein